MSAERTIFDALTRGDHRAAKRLLVANPALVRTTDSYGNIPLAHATLIGNIDLVMLLLEHKSAAFVYTKNNDGQGSQQIAISNRHETIAELFRRSGRLLKRNRGKPGKTTIL